MSLKYIRDYYGVPAKRGQPVRWRTLLGQIISASGPHVVVRLDNFPKQRVILHPKDDDLEYTADAKKGTA